MTQRNTHIVIIGSGLVGSLMACLLAERGYQISLYEKRPPSGQYNTDCGRSINLALSNRGWKALDRIGVRPQVMNCAIPMAGRMMHDVDGALTFQPYGREGEAIFSVSRNQLNSVLLEKARNYHNIKLFFNEQCSGADFDSGIVQFQNKVTGKKSQVNADWILGADGAFSALRAAMQQNPRFNFSQINVEHGYKEISIPPSAKGEFRLEPGALHIWPRKHYMLIALPNCDNSFTATLFFPMEGNPSFQTLATPDVAKDFFQQQFPDALEIMPTFERDFALNPVSNLVTIRCRPWHMGRALLIGDAAHAIVPFYGQGMNAGFEDCTTLDDLLNYFEDDWQKAVAAFEEVRIPDANAIADLALANFVEMRDKVADPDFLLRKKIEARLQELYPDKWKPLYSMVTFSHTRYSHALEIGQKQKAIMDKVLENPQVRAGATEAALLQVPELKTYLNE